MRAYERLLKYAAYPTASDENSPTCPSTPAQLQLGEALVREMQAMGVSDARMDAHGYVYGKLPANIPGWQGTGIGFIAHMDVISEVPCAPVKAKAVRYEGGKLLLNEELGLYLDPEEHTVLNNYVGQDLVVTDGTTILGADDKAGVAEILTMAEYFLTHPELPHGDIAIAFTPDEEIGRGADLFDVPGFGVPFAFTVDGGALGEVEYETFNAARANITVTGCSIHPGAAKDKMRNACQIATEFHAMIPTGEKPEHTCGYEGFYHLIHMEGGVEEAKLSYILRDHDLGKLEQRKARMQAIADYLNGLYIPDTVKVELRDEYRNMAEMVLPHKHLLETAYEAVRSVGAEPVSLPVRGGTDGSRLSFMGLPCPNLGTGSHNHHGRTEFACVQAMDKCVEVLIAIARHYA